MKVEVTLNTDREGEKRMKISSGLSVAIALALAGCGQGTQEEAKTEPAPAAATPVAPATLTADYVIPEGKYTVCYVADHQHGQTTGQHFVAGDTFTLEATAGPEAKLAFSGTGEVKNLAMIKVMPGNKLVGLVQRASLGHKDNGGNAVDIEHVITATVLPEHDPPEGSKCTAGDDVLEFEICLYDADKKEMDCGEDGDYGHVHSDPP
jgi:hypothetical protein